jgi:hypothetical protein
MFTDYLSSVCEGRSPSFAEQGCSLMSYRSLKITVTCGADSAKAEYSSPNGLVRVKSGASAGAAEVGNKESKTLTVTEGMRYGDARARKAGLLHCHRIGLP